MSDKTAMEVQQQSDLEKRHCQMLAMKFLEDANIRHIEHDLSEFIYDLLKEMQGKIDKLTR